MIQMQSNAMNLMQMVTARKAETCRTADATAKDNFRKLLDKDRHVKGSGEAAAPSKEEQPVETAQAEVEESEQKTVRMPADSILRPIRDREELLRLQELASSHMLFGVRQAVTVPQDLQSGAVDTVSAAAGEQGVFVKAAVQADPAGQMVSAEQTGQAASEAVQEFAAAAESTGDTALRHDSADLQQQFSTAEAGEQSGKDDLPELTVETEAQVFKSVETAPIKVSETAAPMRPAQAEPVEEQIAVRVNESVSLGETRVELQLTPESLGKVTIEMVQKEDGSLSIAIQAENSQTRNLLERDLSGLQSLLSRTTQQEVQVNVAQPQEQQQPQDYDGHQQQQHHQQQQENRQRSEEFLNRLRLSLLIPEAEAS